MKNGVWDNFRIEKDSMGEVKVPRDVFWGAQTQRSLENFQAGPTLPLQFIYALAIVKRASALANKECSALSPEKAKLIVAACDEILSGTLGDQFPLKVYQTGSGTQTNMNVNEVIANYAGKTLHPNDDVNKSQSSNDAVPAAMHIASYQAIVKNVLPTITELRNTLNKKSKEFSAIVKVGRTHTMDAVPLTVGQEISGWVAQLDHAIITLKESLKDLLELPLGGTAIGTGLNTPKDFDKKAVAHIKKFTGIPFIVSANKFHQIAAHGALVKAHSALKNTALDLSLIANNIRLLASGPRTGIGEFILPENEPGSSIMPGKVNPTQAEALLQACIRVIGNDVAVSMGALQGEFQLNVAKPLIIATILESAEILSVTCKSFSNKCVNGMKVNKEIIKKHLDETLMLVTALTPHIGYDKAAEIAKKAHKENLTLKQSALSFGIKEKDFEAWVDPKKMV